MKDSNLNNTELKLKKALENYDKTYSKSKNDLEKKFKKLESLHLDFPVQFVKNEKYDDLVLKVSRYKHEGIIVNKELTAMASACKTDYEYLEAQLKLFSADTFLSSKFDKITDSLRNSYVKSRKEMRNLLKTLKELEALQTAMEKLVRAFEADEINFRRFHSLQQNITGL